MSMAPGPRNPALFNPLILICIFGNSVNDYLNTATDSGKEKDHRQPFILDLWGLAFHYTWKLSAWGVQWLACIIILPQTSWMEWTSYTKSLSFNSRCEVTKRPMRAGVSRGISIWDSKVYTFSLHIGSTCAFLEATNDTWLAYNNLFLELWCWLLVFKSCWETWLLGITIISCTLSWQSQTGTSRYVQLCCIVLAVGKTEGSSIRRPGYKS